MPKLLVFAPCQKAILDKHENTISLISVLHSITVSLQSIVPEQPLPPDVVMPLQWAIATIWLRSPNDGDTTFEQRIEIVTPNAQRIVANTQPFQMTHRTHQIIMIADSFPMATPGEHQLILNLREVKPDSDWKEIAEYPIEIKHAQQETQKTG